ncbi:MAG TPA: hypothetical protein VHO01_16305 [Jatrophihabitans sp.]|nr:hypothetical protein [Jatrophihabitans sp.]
MYYLRRAVLLLVLVLTPLCGGVLAIAVAPAVRLHDVGLDGLDLDIRLRLGQGSTDIDSALLGGLRTKAPVLLGKPVGFDIRPSDLNLSLFDAKGALDTATIDVIGHLFSDPKAQRAERDRIVGQVFRYYGSIFCVTVYLLASLELLGYLYLKRRKLQLDRLPMRARPLFQRESTVVHWVAGVLAAALVLPALYVLSPLTNRSSTTQPDPQLSGTFLSGWQLTGPFTYLIRQAATSVDSLAKSEQVFYDQVAKNRDQAYRDYYGSDGLPRDSDFVRIVVLDDLQGTSGMARTVAEAAQKLHADAILNLGDLTATGTPQESYLSYLNGYTVGVLAQYAKTIPIYSSLGRHDTPTVVSYAKKLHITVADGDPHKVAGLPAIGSNSPYIVNFGQAARLKDPAVTTDSVASALQQKACADKPMLVYAHDKELLNGVVDSGCVPLVIGGHSYDGEPSKDISTPSGVVRKVILGSTGGHGAGDGIGGLTTPRNNAPFLLLSIDRKTGEVRVDTTTVHPDASVTVSGTNLSPLTGDERKQLG